MSRKKTDLPELETILLECAQITIELHRPVMACLDVSKLRGHLPRLYQYTLQLYSVALGFEDEELVSFYRQRVDRHLTILERRLEKHQRSKGGESLDDANRAVRLLDEYRKRVDKLIAYTSK